MKKTSTIAIIGITFFWMGLVCGLSFIEAPLKFQAPGITIPLGLGIGKLVFGTLTKLELVISLLLIAFLSLKEAKWKTWLLFLIPILIVVIDNFLLMPVLNQRTEMIINGGTPPLSSLHLWYIILEVVKVFALLFAGVKFLHNHLKLHL